MDTLVDPSINDETNKDTDKDSDSGNAEKEGLLKELRAERDKRHQMEAKMAELESKIGSMSPASSQDDELELAVERLAPILQKKGFITSQQKEDEDRAAKYARDLEDLSHKYDGSDGRPAFDPSEIAEYAKANGIFNLEAAYQHKNWKELVDWEKKRDSSDDIPTEKPSSPSKSNERVVLTSESLKKRMAEPDGALWYEKNREKILAAMQNGQLR